MRCPELLITKLKRTIWPARMAQTASHLSTCLNFRSAWATDPCPVRKRTGHASSQVREPNWPTSCAATAMIFVGLESWPASNCVPYVRSKTAEPPSSGVIGRPATGATRVAPSTTRVATATAQSARRLPRNVGSKHDEPSCYRCRTSISSSHFPTS